MLSIAALQGKLVNSIESLRRKYPSFDEAISSYTAQYGDGTVKVYEPSQISHTIDPVTIILGRTTQLFYKNSKRELSGSLDSVIVESGNTYMLGRRESPDSKLLVWSADGEIEIAEYDIRVTIIPSRIHAAIFGLEDDNVVFADLGSSSGSILVGESSKPKPFISLYGPPHLDVHRVTIPPKYARLKRS
jgi:hypothetical protein